MPLDHLNPMKPEFVMDYGLAVRFAHPTSKTQDFIIIIIPAV